MAACVVALLCESFGDLLDAGSAAAVSAVSLGPHALMRSGLTSRNLQRREELSRAIAETQDKLARLDVLKDHWCSQGIIMENYWLSP